MGFRVYRVAPGMVSWRVRVRRAYAEGVRRGALLWHGASFRSALNTPSLHIWTRVF